MMIEMMVDMSEFTAEELLTDLRDGKEDAQLCVDALEQGVLQYSGGSIVDRLWSNLKINAAIMAELTLRGVVEVAP